MNASEAKSELIAVEEEAEKPLSIPVVNNATFKGGLPSATIERSRVARRLHRVKMKCLRLSRMVSSLKQRTIMVRQWITTPLHYPG